MTKIEKKKFSNDDISNFISLSEDEILRTQELKNTKFIKWKFTLNPRGKSDYFYYKYKKKIVGRILSNYYSGRLIVKKKVYKSFFLSDLYIKKEHRNLSKIKLLYNKSLNNINSIIYHTSNENSEKFYTKILNKRVFFYLHSNGIPLSFKSFAKYKLIGKMFYWTFFKFYLLHLLFVDSISRFYKKLNIKIYKNIFFDNDINYLNIQNIKNNNSFFIKDENFFKWRYENYKDLYFLKIFKKKEFIGYLTLVESKVLNLKNMIVLDFQFSAKLSFIDKLKIKLKIIQISINEKCDTLYIMGNGRSYMFQNLIGYPLFKIPDSLLPHSTPIFFHNVPKKHIDEIRKINFTLSDFDYF